MEQDKKKSELPAEDRDVPQVTGQGDFSSDIGQKGGDASNRDQRDQQGSQGRSDVNASSGQDRDISRGKDQKKDELR